MGGLFATFNSNIFILTYFIIFVSTSSRTIVAASPAKLKLIYQNDILSSYRDLSVTLEEKVRREMDSSMARYAYLEKKISDTIEHGVDIIQQTPTSSRVGILVNISIGDPPVPQLLTMDTGSSLTWAQCLPCAHCFSQPNPFYDPSKSSSYSKVFSNSPDCEGVGIPSTNSSAACPYYVKYADNSSTKGTVGIEKFTFTTSDDGILAIPNLLFGCGHENYEFYSESGVLGLDASPDSFASQLNSTFSYCIGNLSDPNYASNQLVLGEGAIFEDARTPFQVHRDLYYLPLEGISIGNASVGRLDIDPAIFKLTPEGKGGVIIDSGTFLTFLARSAYDGVVAEAQKWINLPRVTLEGYEKLCYQGIMTRDIESFATLTYYFTGGDDVATGADSIFTQYTNDTFCMGITPVPDYSMNVIGISLQQNKNIGYDLKNKIITFENADCQAIDD